MVALQLLRVNISEEGMCHDFLNSSGVSQALSLILLEELGDQIYYSIGILNLVVGAVRENDFGIFYLVRQHVLVPVKERSHSNEHFVHQYSQRPPINVAIVSIVVDHFGSQVLGGSTVTLCHLLIFENLS